MFDCSFERGEVVVSFTLGVLVGLVAGILLAFALAVIGAFVVKKMLASHETQIQTRMMMLSGTFSTMKIVREMFEQGRFSTGEGMVKKHRPLMSLGWKTTA